MNHIIALLPVGGGSCPHDLSVSWFWPPRGLHFCKYEPLSWQVHVTQNVFTINPHLWDKTNKSKTFGISLFCVQSPCIQRSILTFNVSSSSSGRITIPEPVTVHWSPQEEKETGAYTVSNTWLILMGMCVCCVLNALNAAVCAAILCSPSFSTSS